MLLVRVAAIAVPASVTALPQQSRDARGRLVLASGEGSAPVHAVAGPGRLLCGVGGRAEEPGQAWLELTAPALLEHERHAPIELPAGWYRVVRRRGYLPAPLGGSAEF
ncbi:hypothetical protein [Streptacidiphilus sp. MAP12-33]|uniref:hypothetical protein n=1 Tax=Streptacidiphilus sp. MAP12-33 TaxID=3156266 RepID=UPI003514C3C3